MKIHLHIELHGQRSITSLLVEDSTLVSTCVYEIARQFGYPVADAAGVPLTYRLFSGEGRKLLPAYQRLGDLGIEDGSHVLFDCANDQHPAVAVNSPGRRRWKRRTMLQVVGGCAFSGLISGWFVGKGTLPLGSFSTHPRVAGRPQMLHLVSLFRFTVHQQRVRSVVWSPDGGLLASGGDDALVIVWRPDGLTQSQIVHQAPVSALAWSPDGSRLMSGSGNQVRFFTALSGNQLTLGFHGGQVHSVAWSTHGNEWAVSGGDDRRAIVWQTRQYQKQAIFTKHTEPILSTAFAADGQTIASSSEGGAVRVWEAVTAQERHPFYPNNTVSAPAVAFAPMGMSLVAGLSNGSVHLWSNGLQCQKIGTSDQGAICTDESTDLQPLKSTIRALAWSPDGKYLAGGSNDGTLAIWEPAQGQTPLVSMPIGSALQSITWSPDGSKLATAVDQVVVIWNVET